MQDQSPAKCPRPYRLGQREAAMEATRERILLAAREIILGENALDGLSLEAVARRADVTRVTVYHRFGSKRGLLEALFDDMGGRQGFGEKMPALMSLQDPVQALRAYVGLFCEFWESTRAMNGRLRAFAALDAEFSTALEARYDRRRHILSLLLDRLRVAGKIGLTSEAELVTVLALTGFNFYDALASETLDPSQVAAIILRLVSAELNLPHSIFND